MQNAVFGNRRGFSLRHLWSPGYQRRPTFHQPVICTPCLAIVFAHGNYVAHWRRSRPICRPAFGLLPSGFAFSLTARPRPPPPSGILYVYLWWAYDPPHFALHSICGGPVIGIMEPIVSVVGLSWVCNGPMGVCGGPMGARPWAYGFCGP
jgi:hypothetical protein